jgi:hypothetical protein
VEEWAYRGALGAAFWTALLGFARAPAAREHALRFVLGLAAGAALARVGGLLCVPAGPLLVAPWREPGRARFLDAALPTLPLAFGAAKLGCVAAGCCAAAGAEALGFAALHAALALARPRAEAAAALAGIGALRLALLPLRPGAELSGALAIVWLALAALRCRATRGGTRCPRPGSATSRRTAASSRPGCAADSPARATSR